MFSLNQIVLFYSFVIRVLCCVDLQLTDLFSTCRVKNLPTKVYLQDWDHRHQYVGYSGTVYWAQNFQTSVYLCYRYVYKVYNLSSVTCMFYCYTWSGNSCPISMLLTPLNYLPLFYTVYKFTISPEVHSEHKMAQTESSTQGTFKTDQLHLLDPTSM